MPKKQPAKVESPTRKSQRIAPKKPDKQIKQADKYKFHGTKGEKPFECLLCGRYYASKTTWYRHNSSKHAVNDYYSGSQKTTKQKTYRCLYCKESQMTHWFSEKHVPKCLFKHKQVTLCQNSSSRKRNPATLTADGFKYTEYDNTGAVLSIRFATNKATSNEGNEGYELLSPPKLSPLQKISHWVRPSRILSQALPGHFLDEHLAALMGRASHLLQLALYILCINSFVLIIDFCALKPRLVRQCPRTSVKKCKIGLRVALAASYLKRFLGIS